MNTFKQRESYRPFAPAIMQEHLSEYFEWGVDSPFMSFAVKASALAKSKIPAGVHADGTARVQTLAPDSSSPLRPILERFHALTGTPVLLNTSFNRKGEPMVQTPTEAVDAFIHSELLFIKLPWLFLNPWVGRRTAWPDARDDEAYGDRPLAAHAAA